MFPVMIWVAIGFTIYFLCYYVVINLADDFFKKDLRKNPILEITHVLLQTASAIILLYHFIRN